MSFQDWKPVVIYKRYDPNAARQNGHVVETVRKTVLEGSSTIEIDRATDVTEIPKSVPVPGLGARISQARAALKLSQKELAQKINEPVAVVNSIESSKTKASNAILQKMERVLQVKLRGNISN